MPKHVLVKTSFRGSIQERLLPASVFDHKSLIVLTLSILLASLLGAWRIKIHVGRQLDEERELLEKQNIIPFEKKPRPSFASKELEVWQSYKNSRAIARFKDSYFVATDGGLVEFAASGNLVQHYSVLDGLPESDLLSLAKSADERVFPSPETIGL